MLIKQGDSLPWVICKICDSKFKMGGRCECGNIKTTDQGDGSTLIQSADSDSVVIDTE